MLLTTTKIKNLDNTNKSLTFEYSYIKPPSFHCLKNNRIYLSFSFTINNTTKEFGTWFHHYILIKIFIIGTFLEISKVKLLLELLRFLIHVVVIRTSSFYFQAYSFEFNVGFPQYQSVSSAPLQAIPPRKLWKDSKSN